MRPFSRLLHAVLVAALVLSPVSAFASTRYQITGISFSNATDGFMVGGYSAGGVSTGFISQTSDGGLSWKAVAAPGNWMRGVGAFGPAAWSVEEFGKRPFKISSGPSFAPSSGSVSGDIRLRDAAVLAGGSRVAVVGRRVGSSGADGGLISISGNSGATWTDAYTGPRKPPPSSFEPPPPVYAEVVAIDSEPTGTVAFAVGNDYADVAMTVHSKAFFLRSADGGLTWSSLTTPSTAGKTVYDVATVDGNVAFVTGASRMLFRTIDGGATWTGSATHVPLDFGSAVTSMQGFAIDALDANTVLIAGQDGKIAWSTNAMSTAASSWRFRNVPGRPELHGVKMLSATEWIVVGNNETIYRTMDAGATWTGTTGLKAPRTTDLSASTTAPVSGKADDFDAASGFNGVGVTRVEVSVQNPEGKYLASLNPATWQTAKAWLPAQTSNGWADWTFDWRLPNGNGGYYVTARAIDALGSAGSSSWGEPAVPPVDPVIELAGDNRYETAIKISQLAFPDGAGTAVLATGDNWPDALGGTGLAGALDGPVLLTRAGALPSTVLAEIGRLKSTRIIIVGGEAAVGKAVEDALKAKGLVVERIAGSNRYETADKIAVRVKSELGSSFTGRAFVATGKNFPDALAAAPVAAAAGMPLYLADPATGLSDATKAAMSGVTEVAILGGVTVVTPATESYLKGRFGSGKVERLAGSDRFATSVEVAKYAVAKRGHVYDRVGIATGANFPDALAGGVLQGKVGSVMLLTPGTQLAPAVRTALEGNALNIDSVTFFGGSTAVSSSVRNEVKAAAGIK